MGLATTLAWAVVANANAIAARLANRRFMCPPKWIGSEVGVENHAVARLPALEARERVVHLAHRVMLDPRSEGMAGGEVEHRRHAARRPRAPTGTAPLRADAIE